MKCDKHQLKFLRQSMVWYDKKLTTIDVWQCQICKKYLIIDVKKDRKIHLDDKIGEEI